MIVSALQEVFCLDEHGLIVLILWTAHHELEEFLVGRGACRCACPSVNNLLGGSPSICD